MYTVRFVYLPQWEFEISKILARQEIPLCMPYAAYPSHCFLLPHSHVEWEEI